MFLAANESMSKEMNMSEHEEIVVVGVGIWGCMVARVLAGAARAVLPYGVVKVLKKLMR